MEELVEKTLLIQRHGILLHKEKSVRMSVKIASAKRRKLSEGPSLKAN